MGQINKSTVQSYYQNAGDVYDDSKPEAIFDMIVDAHNATDLAVTEGLGDGAIETAQIADSAITAAKIADGSIIAAKFVAGALTNETANGLEIVALKADFANKVPDVYNVIGYGVKGDGSTDDLAAIQDAIDTCNENGGGIVYFPIPSVDYRVSDSIEIKAYVRLVGAHRRATIIRASGTGYAIINQAVGVAQCSVENLSIAGLDVNNKADVGVDIYDGDVSVKSCNISACTKGVQVTQQYYNLVDDTDFIYCDTGVYLATGVGGANSNQITNCKFTNLTTGVNVETGCIMNGIMGCDFENLTDGIIYNGKYGLIANNYFETVTNSHIDISSAVGTQVGPNNHSGTPTNKVKQSTTNRTNQVFINADSSANLKQFLGTMMVENTGATEFRYNSGSTTQFNVFFDSCNIRMGGNKGYFQGTYLWFQAVASSDPSNGSIFVDSSDNKLKFKDSAGTVKPIHAITTATTAGRPTSNLYAGMAVYDTTLDKPIWRNAANSGWVDATGTSV